jgi:glycosyltransferase involved in cell wall biosynthesis
VRLFVVGRGSEAALGSVLRPVVERVAFLGVRDDIAALFAAMDCFVYPSRYDSFGLVVLEALATGLPVITSTGAGVSELLENGRDALVLQDPADVSGLVLAVRSLIEDGAAALALGHAGRELAVKHDWQTMGARYEQLYEDVLREKSASRVR